MKGKFVRDDMEQSEDFSKRFKALLSELEVNRNYMLFSHGGIVGFVARMIGITDLYLDNCGVMGFTIDDEGMPQHLIGLYNKSGSGKIM